jgi:hypothetical protein
MLGSHGSLSHHCYISIPQVHLAITESTDVYRLTWKTDNPGCESSVRYGLTSEGGSIGRSSQLALGRSYPLNNNHMCGGKAKDTAFSFHMHTALLERLWPETEYEYLIAGANEQDARVFISGPSGPKDSISFIAYGDMGAQGKKIVMASATVETALEEHLRDPLDFILHVGDISYGDGRPKQWESFMSQIEPVAQAVPYMVAIGNHDYGYDLGDSPSNDLSGANGPYRPSWGNYGSESAGECGAMTAGHFIMPSSSSYPITLSPRLSNTSGVSSEATQRRLEARTSASHQEGRNNMSLHTHAAPNPPFWYSYEYGAVHVTVLSSEHDISPYYSIQYQWLQSDLADVDRCRTPWLVVVSHRPMYVVYPHKSNRDVGAHLRDSLEDLLIEYKVDMVLSGHVHSYYRSCSVNQEVCSDDQTGVVHFVIGTGGHPLSDVEDQQRLWVSAAVIENGLGRFDIEGDRLDFVFIRSEDRQVVDRHRQWAQVPKDECQSFMGSRRLPGVERSQSYVARRTGGTPSDVLQTMPGLQKERMGQMSDESER